MLFFKWVRISPEIEWYHYQGACPAPTCKVQHQTLIKTLQIEVSHQSPVYYVPPPPPLLLNSPGKETTKTDQAANISLETEF